MTDRVPADGAGDSTARAERATAESEAFDSLVEAITETTLEMHPEFATYLGMPDETGDSHLGRLRDYGLEGRARRREVRAQSLAELEAVDAARLDDARRLTLAVLLERLGAISAADEAAGRTGLAELDEHLVYPVSQIAGPHLDLPNLMQAQQPVRNAGQAAAYVERLRGFETAFGDLVAVIESDCDAGFVPPRFVLAKTRALIANLVADAPARHVLGTSFAAKLAAAGVDAAGDWAARAERAIAAHVVPAYARLDAALAKLERGAMRAAGLDGKSGGIALYHALIALNADSNLAPGEIHEVGLAEVERIGREMEAILARQGYADGTLAERMAALAREPRFLYTNDDAGKARLISDLNAQVAEVQALAPRWFGAIPPQSVEVRRVPAYSEQSAPGGYYDLPSLDGSRPGIYWVNLRDTASNPTFSLKSLTYHEAVPGHHYQVALNMALVGVPLLRKVLGNTNAYAEGWALYAEYLAVEMGLYEGDDFGNLGRLQHELLRAVRLVVDTGLHTNGWSRERAIAYMVATGAATPSDAEIETERYCVLPAQALGYKIGMLKVLDLRSRAARALGNRFDVRSFHDAVLIAGGLPLPILETRIERWIERALDTEASSPG